MSTKIERRSSHHDLIDDIVESPSSSNLISSLLINGSKTLQNRNYSSYSSLPSLYNKSKFEQQTDNTSGILTDEHRDQLHLTLPRSNSSSIIMSNDERRKQIDVIIKHLYDGKLLSSANDDRPISEISEPSIPMLSKGPTTTTTTAIKNNQESRHHVGNIDLLSFDGDITSLQRELQEKELDIIHLHKEIQELQTENKILKTKVPIVYSNGYTNNHNEIETLRREKDILQNELRISQELIEKIQHQNIVTNHSNRFDEIPLNQKELLEKKLNSYEKQIYTLTNENDKLKQNSHQIKQIILQLKRENEELQKKLTEAKKRNDELFYQELNSLRTDIKLLKKQNNELFEENLHLQQQISPLKIPHSDSKHLKITRNESPNISETSDSTNYLATVNVEHYNTRLNHSAVIDRNNHYRTIKQDDINRNNYSIPLSKSIDQQLNFRSSKTKRTVEWDEGNNITNYDYPIHRNESRYHSRRSINNNQQDDHRQTRRTIETISPRRPYAPSSINDIHLNDIIKFSRPGGKITKGIVKYIGPLPDKTDQYLGLELESEESKHDGVYHDHRLFQCKPNKGIFVSFNKVIMAWSGN